MPDKSIKQTKTAKTTKKKATKARIVTTKKAVTKKTATKKVVAADPIPTKAHIEQKKGVPEPVVTVPIQTIQPEPIPPKRGLPNFLRVGIILLLGILVSFEVFYVVKTKTDQQRVLRRLPDIIGVRGLPDRPGHFTGPIYLRKDSLNRLLLVDINLHKIIVWDIATRKSLFDITRIQAKKETFDPYLVDVDGDGNIAAWDRTNSEIVIFNSTGKFMQRWQVPPTSGLTFDSIWNVYISDATRNVVVQFSPTGQQLNTIGKNKLTQPRNLTTDDEGNLYVVDKGAKRVNVFSPTGKFVRYWKTTAEVIDLQGNEVYMLDLTDNMLKKY